MAQSCCDCVDNSYATGQRSCRATVAAVAAYSEEVIDGFEHTCRCELRRCASQANSRHASGTDEAATIRFRRGTITAYSRIHNGFCTAGECWPTLSKHPRIILVVLSCIGSVGDGCTCDTRVDWNHGHVAARRPDCLELIGGEVLAAFTQMVRTLRVEDACWSQ